VKTNADMVNANTSKRVSPTNFHVSKVTLQVLGIANSILQVRLQLSKVSEVQSLEPQLSKVQASKAQVSKVQTSEPQVSEIKTSKVQVLEVHILSIKLQRFKFRIYIQVSDFQVHILIFQ
jgi:hypothetical protein